MRLFSSITAVLLAFMTVSCGPASADAGSISPPSGNPEPPKTEPSTPPSEPHDLCYVKGGVLYTPEGKEMSFLGVNFQTPLSWEANRLSKVGVKKTAEALNAVTDNNIADIIRMGATEIRCHLTPADFTDSEGNLTQTAYLDALDYLVYKAEQNGLYVSFAFLNDMKQSGPGKEWTSKGAETWIHDQKVVEATRNYIRQLVTRVNKYSGKAYKDTKCIAYWELINEPDMYSYSEIGTSGYADDYKAWLASKIMTDTAANYALYRTWKVQDYIDSMVDLLRTAGDNHPVCWGLNWHRYRKNNADIFAGVAASKADVVAFCNYPGQDYVTQDYWNNSYDFTTRSFASWFNEQYSSANGYGWTLSEEFSGKAKVAYEFETFFNQSAYVYPIQADYFKALGAQGGSMWTYTFAEIAEYFGGSHFLNLRCTPGKAASFLVASYVIKSEKRGHSIKVEDEMSGSNWATSLSHNAAVYCDSERYINSGPVPDSWNPVPPANTVKHVAGCGSSPLVKYSGTGMYFIDETSEGLVIELMPDVEVVGDQFKGSSYTSKVTVLDSSKENDLSIDLKNWKSKSAKLYKLTVTGTEEVGQISGTSSLKLAPGKYLVK